jgi:hypothetical protein
MRYIRTLAPATVVLALTIILAACTQAASPSQSPSASPDPSPTEEPSASESPSEEPSESEDPSPSPSEPELVEIDLPTIGRVTEETVVRAEPAADAPVQTGEFFSVGADPEVVEAILEAGDEVVVTMGPLFNDGESWYEVASVDGADLVFAFGWIPGRYIESEGETDLGFIVVDINGQGEGASDSVGTIGGHPVTARFAAAPMPGADECEIDVTVINTDGSAANIATQTVDGVVVSGDVTPFEIPSLFQNEAGEVTLEVETDCSFAAQMTMPAS